MTRRATRRRRTLLLVAPVWEAASVGTGAIRHAVECGFCRHVRVGGDTWECGVDVAEEVAIGLDLRLVDRTKVTIQLVLQVSLRLGVVVEFGELGGDEHGPMGE